MICVDQGTAERNQQPLAVLAKSRGKKLPFGILLQLCSSPAIGIFKEEATCIQVQSHVAVSSVAEVKRGPVESLPNCL